ncbi:MAG: FkbM family methyltransferase [Vicinamibacterales bacterium]
MSLIGPYRGIRFDLTGPMRTRREVFFRAYEPAVTCWLKAAVEPGMTAYVVGAHVGIHALMLGKRLRGRGRVFAFEGWPENYRSLAANIACNPALTRVLIPVHLAVGRSSGMTQMTSGSSDGRHHLAMEGDGVSDRVDVPSTTLDDFWAATGGCVDVVLIDIEGFELEALEGARRLLAACRPLLVVEHHRKIEVLCRWLLHHGYEVQTVDRRHIFAV